MVRWTCHVRSLREFAALTPRGSARSTLAARPAHGRQGTAAADAARDAFDVFLWAFEALPPGLNVAALREEGADPSIGRGGNGAPLRPHLRTVELAGRRFTAAVHQRVGATIIELEPAHETDATLAGAVEIVQRLADRLEAADVPAKAARLLLDAIAQLTGFDRAMAYRFLPGWHGEVIVERLAPGVEGFRGLRFPARGIRRR